MSYKANFSLNHPFLNPEWNYPVVISYSETISEKIKCYGIRVLYSMAKHS